MTPLLLVSGLLGFQSRDLAVGHFEITQGLQRAANDIPLVQGKPTAIRVFPIVKDGQESVAGVSARLHAMRNCSELPGSPIEPDNGPIQVGASFDRGQVDHALNFLTLDPDWYALDTAFWVELVMPAGIDDPNPGDNRFPAGEDRFRARYVDRRGYAIRHVIVRYTNPNWMGAPVPRPRVIEQATCDWLRMIFPADPLEMPYDPWDPVEITFGSGSSGGNLAGTALITELNTLYAANPTPPDKLYGWTPDSSFSSNGLSDPFWAGGLNRVAFGNDTGEPMTPMASRFRRTFAHEIGHNTDNNGLFHTSRRLQNDEFGLDVMGVDPFNRVVMRKYPPGDPQGSLDLLDVMSPGEVEPHAWIAPPHYDHLFRVLAPSAIADAAVDLASAGGNGADDRADAPAPAEDVMVVRGVVKADGNGSFLPFYRIPATPENRAQAAKPPQQGTHEVRFLDGEDQVMLRLAWTPDFRADDHEGDLTERAFTFLVSPPAGVKRVVLAINDNVKATLDVLAQATAVTDLEQDAREAAVDNPEDASIALTWKVDRPELAGDEEPELVHQVYYSNDDGKTWRLVATGLKAQEADVRLAGLPGGERCRWQVRTSDGYNVSTTTSDRFEVASKPPQVTIISPRTRLTYRQGAGVLLQGRAFDAERGALPDEKLVWVSDLQEGEIGRGARVVVRDLKPGKHTITLKATDDAGNSGDSPPLSITIEPRP